MVSLKSAFSHCSWLFLVITSLWRNFKSHDFQICIFCRTFWDGPSVCKVSMLQVVFGKFYRQIKKNTMMASSWCHFMFLEFENLKFCKTVYNCYIGYQVVKFQFSWLSESNFMKVGVRSPKHHYDVISTHCVCELAYFIEHGVWLKFSGGRVGDTIKTPSLLRTTFALTHPLF